MAIVHGQASKRADRHPNEQTGIQTDRRAPKQIDEQIKKKAGKIR